MVMLLLNQEAESVLVPFPLPLQPKLRISLRYHSLLNPIKRFRIKKKDDIIICMIGFNIVTL